MAVALTWPQVPDEEATRSDLRLAVFDARKLTRSDDVSLHEGAFHRTWAFMGTPPAVSFLTPSRVFVSAGTPSTLRNVVHDLSTHALSPLEGDDVKGGGAGAIVALGPGKVLDARTMRSFSLEPDDASMKGARHIGPECR